MAQVPAYSSLDDRLTRLEDSDQQRSERLATHVAEDRLAFENIQKNLNSIETKVDQVIDRVANQHDKWVGFRSYSKN